MLKMTLHYKRGHAKTSMDFWDDEDGGENADDYMETALQPSYRQYLF